MYYAMVGWFRDQGKKVHCAPMIYGVSFYLAPKIVLFLFTLTDASMSALGLEVHYFF